MLLAKITGYVENTGSEILNICSTLREQLKLSRGVF